MSAADKAVFARMAAARKAYELSMKLLAHRYPSRASVEAAAEAHRKVAATYEAGPYRERHLAEAARLLAKIHGLEVARKRSEADTELRRRW